ncbi:MAG: sigma-54-dependent Fis family transcriptional regulator [Magnetococcales bacterium]|nr:sigma-54-dependent Fis family transcriptional regulator [Magnetococcales bacterium]
MEPILLVDDEEDLLFTSSLILEKAGQGPVLTLTDGREVMPLLERLQGRLRTVVLDLYMPHLSGQELLKRIHERFPELPIIIMTAGQEVESAVACMKAGACDYLVKPVEESRFVASIAQQSEIIRLRSQIQQLESALINGQLRFPDAFDHMPFCSPLMLATMQCLESVALSREPILLLGESGVGKGLAVKALHRLSCPEAPLVPVNVAGLDDAMFADTLFGHIKGAFSGAISQRPGLVAASQNGILFLDEIGDISTVSQLKLLQLIQERNYSPIGSDHYYPCQSRIVCATNADLERQVAAARFRPDLYYRLKVHKIRIPPLRERQEDIPLLARYFLDEAAQQMGKESPTPPPELFTLLCCHSFPGNVRELRALCYDAVAKHTKGVLSLAVFQESLASTSDTGPAIAAASSGDKLAILNSFPSLEEAELFLIQEALKRTKGNQTIAASLLGISRRALNGRLSRLSGFYPSPPDPLSHKGRGGV